MQYKGLHILFLLAIPLFIMHGLEEYFTSFYDGDFFFVSVFHFFESMSIFQATFLLFQMMFWLLLITSYLFWIKKGMIVLLGILGLIFIFEVHHIIEALLRGGYYPGLITGLFLPILGFFYWKELVKNWKQYVH